MSRSPQNSNCWSAWHERLHKKLKVNPELVPKGSTLLLAISGGQDSISLLKLMIDLNRIYQWNINIWHGDHNWHSKSTQISQELKTWCLSKNLNFFCDKGSKEKLNNENKAREWRYHHLIETAKLISKTSKNPCTRILTGHTASDRAETVIMNLARGTDITGLSTLGEKRFLTDTIQLIRPLLGFSRKETYQICTEMKLPIWLDPSNQNHHYKRNKIRHKVIPILNEMHHGSELRISALAERLESYKKDQQYLSELALNEIQAQSEHRLCLQKLKVIPLSTRRILLATWLKKLSVSNITSVLIDEINQKISKNHYKASITLAKGSSIIWTKKELIFKNINNPESIL